MNNAVRRGLWDGETPYNQAVDWTYLDNNATTRPADGVADAVRQAHETLWANPSSVHRFGQAVRQRVELARASVASLIHAKDREVVFTSGGTESNNLALRGMLEPAHGDAPRPLLITTRVEHSAIREPAAELEHRGVEVVYLRVDGDGRADVSDLERLLRERAPGANALVSVQWANNETGVIQPVEAIAAAVEAARGAAGAGRLLLHIDATQAAGKIPVDVKAVSADLLTLSAHKFHGPKGVGALYIRTGVRPRPLLLGGPQERDRRGGTENSPGILGMGVAAELARTFLTDAREIARLQAMRDRFERGVLAACPGAVVNSGSAPRLWNTSNIGFPRLEAEAILMALSERGLCASAGAACSSGSLEPSPVLLAMGIPEAVAHGSVRFSISRFTTDAEIDRALEIVPAVVARLSKTLPVSSR
ncbi:MAG: cysteine desulfurase [Planctomycetes bacterium]|nr:cysteine desulfurase [Planctomycetota bacterium]